MRKLKLQVQISVDGFVSTGPDDKQQWVTWAWEEIRPEVLQLFDACDTILIGRKLAIDYIPHWENTSKKPEDPMYEVGQRIANAKKIVFTKTLTESEWNNTVLATGDLVTEVNTLKTQPGKDLIVYGGSSFVSSLIKEGLIDEFNLFVNPVAIGHGEGIFNQLPTFKSLQLTNSKIYSCGIVWLQYLPK